MYSLVVCGKDGEVVQQVPISKGEWLIGRQNGNHIVLPSSTVSRQHARIYTAQGRCYIQDLKSANGVVLEGRRIQEVEEFKPQNRAVVGEYTLFLQARGEEDGAEPVISTHIVTSDKEHPKLVGLNGPFEGEEFGLSERENTIGRTEDNFILLPDPSVSRGHARIVVDEHGRFVLYDLHSSNGSYVNRKKVQRALIRDGDLVTIGNVTFRFVEPRSARSQSNTGIGTAGKRQALVVGLVALLLLMAGATVGLVIFRAWKDDQAQTARQEGFKNAMASGKAAVSDRKWAAAIKELERAAALNALDREIPSLLAKARAELENQRNLQKADDLFVAGQLQEAMAVVERIPATSVFYPSVAQKLADIKTRLAQQLLQEGVAACKKKKWETCHGLLCKTMDLQPDNTDVLTRLRSVEKKMRKKRISFQRWEPDAR